MMELNVRLSLGRFQLDVEFSSDATALGLWGPSGSGKTSVLNAIAGLLPPSAGRIVLDGDVLFDSATGLCVPPERRGIGYLFQEPRLFPNMEVRANLAYAGRHGGRKSALATDEVADALALKPLMDRRTEGLSGGEARRVALGRALLSAPRLLLLDEPLAGLDPALGASILPYLREVSRRWGIPFILVSHSLGDMLSLATEVVAVCDGRVTGQGPPLDLLLGDGVPPQESVINRLELPVETDPATGRQRARLGDQWLSLPSPVPGDSAVITLGAEDILLARMDADLRGLSVRNRIEVRVRSIHERAPGVLVVLDAGAAQPLLALVTQEALRDLALKPGEKAWALVKTSALQVE